MTTDTSPVVDDQYDPDAPPEGSFITDFEGIMVNSLQVSQANIGTVDEHIRKSVQDYWDAKKNTYPVWFLEAHGLSVVRTDGAPFRQSDILSLTDKNGKWLGKKMTPDVLATQFRGFNVSISPQRVGQPDSAVGRAFHFKAHELKTGKRWTKTISLWPEEIHEAGWVYTGEITQIEPKANDDSGSAPSNIPVVSDADATVLLRQVLAGATPAEMFDRIMNDERLRPVGKVFGVSLMEAATDESLAGVLTENGVLTLGADGKFTVPA